MPTSRANAIADASSAVGSSAAPRSPARARTLTAQLIDDVIHGWTETSSANALLYFELDSGAPAARAQHMPPHQPWPLPNSSALN
ncbi:hypothetical protein [Streptomyces goshikiensis]|uniref:hypothetical protein n=1 Tax=Streptomyces goshikiensis TaxID=1942 RepID=UPI0036B3B61B